MSLSINTIAILCLACATVILALVAFFSIRGLLRCTRGCADEQKRIVDLMGKIQSSHEDAAKNFHDVADRCVGVVSEVGKIVHDLHKYFEHNALTRKEIPLEQEESPT